jgi:hypothetical protein
MQSKWIERLSDDELEARIAETEELLRWGSKRIEHHCNTRILLMLLRDERELRQDAAQPEEQ